MNLLNFTSVGATLAVALNNGMNTVNRTTASCFGHTKINSRIVTDNHLLLLLGVNITKI
jgi:hypothetical protein